MSTATPPVSDPRTKTVSYGLAPGAVDEDIDVQSEEMLVNMGPQHPSTHGVLRIVLRTDGQNSPPGSAPENAFDRKPGFHVVGSHAGTGWNSRLTRPIVTRTRDPGPSGGRSGTRA